MRVYIVDLLEPELRKESETADLSDAPSINSLTWIPVPRSIDAAQLDYFVTHTPASLLRSDAVFIGLHPDSAARVHAIGHVLDDVSRRVPSSLAVVVHSTGREPTICHVAGDKLDGLEDPATLACIRQHDVTDLVRRPGAELPKHASIHYEGPNRDHYIAFLRPGFGARSVEELDRLAFWLAPMVLNRECFVVDHWSMIPIAYHVGEYLNRLGSRTRVRVASLTGYNEDDDLLARRMEITFESVRRRAGVALVSVNSSGRLVRDLILPTMERVGLTDPISIALARTPNPPDYPLPALAVLSEDFRRYTASECPACLKGGSTAIPIQHDSYLLTLAAYTRDVAITRKGAETSTRVVERYRGINAFRVHRTHSDGRHHSYFVDLEPMLERPVFGKRLAQKLDPWRSAGIDVILHPRHAAAAQLASMVAAELGVADIVDCDEGELTRLEGQDRETVISARRMCVVDDVVISGARIFGYRTAINSIRRRYCATACDLYCLVGVARPRNEKALLGVSDIVHHTERHQRFISVECLFLPNWNDAECHWCAELKVLDSLPQDIRDGALIRERREALRDPDGLVEHLFFPWTGGGRSEGREAEDGCRNGALPGRRFWDLGPNSVFGSVQDADLAASVAASIQRMRGMRRKANGTWKESELDEVFQSPIAKVLDPRRYLAGRYYEPVIVASILRATRAHDVTPPGDDAELRARLEIVAAADASTELHGELMLAAALGQVPRVPYRMSKAHPELAAVVQEILGPETSSA